MKNYAVEFNKKNVFIIFLLIFLSLAAIIFLVLPTFSFSSPKNFDFKTFSFAGKEDMKLVAYDYSDVTQGELVGLQTNYEDGTFWSIYLYSQPGSVQELVLNEPGYKPSVINGKHGYRIKSFGTPDDSSETDTFVFENNNRSYSIKYSKHPSIAFQPYSLVSAVKNFTPKDILLQPIVITPSPAPLSPSTYEYPTGCQSSDPSFCSFSEQIKMLLETEKYDELADLSVTHDLECGNSEYQWSACNGKKDGSVVSVYSILAIASEGGPATKEEYIKEISSKYREENVNIFQTSVSNHDTGLIIFLDQEQEKALAFHSEKINNQWKVDFVNVGVNLGPGGFSDSENLFVQQSSP